MRLALTGLMLCVAFTGCYLSWFVDLPAWASALNCLLALVIICYCIRRLNGATSSSPRH